MAATCGNFINVGGGVGFSCDKDRGHDDSDADPKEHNHEASDETESGVQYWVIWPGREPYELLDARTPADQETSGGS